MPDESEEDDYLFYGKKLVILIRPAWRSKMHKFRPKPATIGDFTFKEWQKIFSLIVLNPYARQWFWMRDDGKGFKEEIIIRIYDPKITEEEQEAMDLLRPPPTPIEKLPPKIDKRKRKRARQPHLKAIVIHEECIKDQTPIPDGYEIEMGTLIPINPKKQTIKIFKNPIK